jgi:voltage-gated potassium channel Kch
VFPVLHAMRLGHRVSLQPAINLCQVSELSLVLLALGKASGDVSDSAIGAVAFAFAILAVASTYAIDRSDHLLRAASPWLAKLGFADLPAHAPAADDEGQGRVFLLGFTWTASSLVEEIRRRRPDLLGELCIVDFNPQVVERLRERGVRVIYGDVSRRDTLLHAGLAHAEIVVCSLSDMLLKGASNERLLRQVREINPTAKVVVHADSLANAATLYEAGASYVSAPRLLEADDLLAAVEAAAAGALDAKREGQRARLAGRDEVIP